MENSTQENIISNPKKMTLNFSNILGNFDKSEVLHQNKKSQLPKLCNNNSQLEILQSKIEEVSKISEISFNDKSNSKSKSRAIDFEMDSYSKLLKAEETERNNDRQFNKNNFWI